jgi:hypothetical protein
MSENEIRVWCTWYADRGSYVLQWKNPETGRVKSKSAKTADYEEAQRQRVILEHELHKEYSYVTYREPSPARVQELESALPILAVPNKCVYFIRQKPSGPIKIGTTNDPENRLAALQTSTHIPLELLGVVRGGKELESRFHSVFAASRLRGEWFEPSRTLLRFINQFAFRDYSLPHAEGFPSDHEPSEFDKE